MQETAVIQAEQPSSQLIAFCQVGVRANAKFGSVPFFSFFLGVGEHIHVHATKETTSVKRKAFHS